MVANNKHGPGVSTEDIVVRTLSDGQLVDEEQINQTAFQRQIDFIKVTDNKHKKEDTVYTDVCLRQT